MVFVIIAEQQKGELSGNIEKEQMLPTNKCFRFENVRKAWNKTESSVVACRNRLCVVETVPRDWWYRLHASSKMTSTLGASSGKGSADNVRS